MQHFLRNCPQLTCLCLLAAPARNLLEDEDIRNLPLTCPLLRELTLIDCATGITDAAVVAALEGLAYNNVQCLTFCCCALLTDAILPKIAELCPHITALSICGTATSKDGALQFLLRMAEKDSFVEFNASTEDMKMWLQQQIKERRLIVKALINWW